MSVILRENIKELRKELKNIGYKLKTESLNNLKVFASIYLNDVFIYGSGANVYTSKTFEENKKAIDIFKKYEL
jgi:hypothetical protein